MARNRVIYQSEALYVSKDASSIASGEHAQLERVQSANYSFNINRQDVNQYGTLARIGTEIIEPPTVTADFSYYLTQGFNEKALNFSVQTGYKNSGNFPSGHMVGGSGQNLYILTVPEGVDADDVDAGEYTPSAANNNAFQFVGIGNCYISDYTVDLAVGALPTVSVTMEGSNIVSDVTVSGQNNFGFTGIETPAVNQESGTDLGLFVTIPYPSSGVISTNDVVYPVALRPADVSVSLGTLSDDSMVVIDGSDEAHIQSCSISLPLSRTPLNRLGSKFAYARTVDFPIAATLSINAIVNEQKALNLADRLDEFDQKEISVVINNPKATGNGLPFDYETNNNRAIAYTFKGASLDNTSISSSIGANKSVDLTFSTEIGGVNDADHGVFVHVSSGITSGDAPIWGPGLSDNYTA